MYQFHSYFFLNERPRIPWTARLRQLVLQILAPHLEDNSPHTEDNSPQVYENILLLKLFLATI